MSRYIDADKLKYSLELSIKSWGRDCNSNAPVIVQTFKDVLYRLETMPSADVVEIPEGGIGNLSDGYHTFNELYHHRAILFSVICNSMPDKAWKSKLHDTGDMFDGMFIVGIETPEGQATYHYDIEPYWDIFKVKELEKAPKWDGHTPQDAIDRISKISADVVEVVHAYWKETTHITESKRHREIHSKLYNCSNCDAPNGRKKSSYCHWCGAKMDGERSKNG